jgi:hypothetical protein
MTLLGRRIRRRGAFRSRRLLWCRSEIPRAGGLTTREIEQLPPRTHTVPETENREGNGALDSRFKQTCGASSQ